MKQPKLIEPGTKYFLKETIKQHHKVNFDRYNILVNIFLFLFFALVVYSFLAFKKKEKLKKKPRKQNITEQQQIILEILKKASSKKIEENHSQSMITSLPKFETDFNIFH